MSNPKSISLTASELGYLWTGYSINEMSKWYLTLFQQQAKDGEIRDLFSYALKCTTEMLNGRKEILTQEGYPIPVGFSDTDIDNGPAPLFSDRFLAYYLYSGSLLGLEFHSRSIASATRSDVRKYNIDCLHSAIQLYEQVVQLLLNKGLYWRTPTLTAPTMPESIQKESYLSGWFGDGRPMNSMEMANHYQVMELLVMMETLFIGFSQTSDTEEVVELFKKGIAVVQSQYQALAEPLEKDGLPIPPRYLAEITDSKNRVFSDRIMVSHMTGLFGSLLSQYGFSLGSVMKHDLLTSYLMQISKGGVFVERVTKFLIEKKWLEKVPGAISRN